MVNINEIKKGDKLLLVPNDHMVEILKVVKEDDVLKGFETKLYLANNSKYEKYMSTEDYEEMKHQLFKLPD